MLNKIKHIHFIGIGSIGMSVLAGLLNARNFIISGSYIAKSDITQNLVEKGINLNIGHDSSNISNPGFVVYSATIDKNNIELQTAIKKDIKSISRGQLLAEVSKLSKNSIAFSGTHGKTTTTSLLGFIFREADLNPVVISSGIISNFSNNITDGYGLITITESDEYIQSFMHLQPDYSIITNIDFDPMECYANLEGLKNNFIKFTNQTKPKVILCCDDKTIKSINSGISTQKKYYSIEKETDFYAKNIESQNYKRCFTLNKEQKFQRPLPGKHNIQNLLPAIAISQEFDINPEKIKNPLNKYHNVSRGYNYYQGSKWE